MDMQRYMVNQFDSATFQVIDQLEQREICICANYDDAEYSKENAETIASLLNRYDIENLTKSKDQV
jgi:hypothetical protein